MVLIRLLTEGIQVEYHYSKQKSSWTLCMVAIDRGENLCRARLHQFNGVNQDYENHLHQSTFKEDAWWTLFAPKDV